MLSSMNFDNFAIGFDEENIQSSGVKGVIKSRSFHCWVLYYIWQSGVLVINICLSVIQNNIMHYQIGLSWY